MKRILFLFAALALSAVAAGPLMAQGNSFVGTWKLNLAKSKFGSMPAPKSLNREVVAQGAGATYTSSGVAADGSAVNYSFTTNYDGKDQPVTGSGTPGGADAIAIKRVSPNKAEATLKKGGKQIGTAVATVSKDGKTTTVTTTMKSADGKDVVATSVYDKQ
ncbi:MAG TPA: hypothetical protein VK795_09760 [Terriglobales bacterium]|jgi:hypothetical protein|nr:hypothetical protein [Terriglobales bacterium]